MSGGLWDQRVIKLLLSLVEKEGAHNAPLLFDLFYRLFYNPFYRLP